MRRSAPFLALALAALILPGCDAFFELNLFAPFETAGIIPSSSEIRKMDVEDIETLAGSDAFFEELADDPGAQDDFIDRLQEIETDPHSTDTEVQTAALLESEIYFETTPAGDAVDNLIDYLAENPPSGDYSAYTAADAAAFVEAIVPPGVLDDFSSFEEMIQALENAYDPLMLYGSLIDDPSDDPSVDSAVPGEIAMNAVVCALVETIVPPAGMSRSEALWLLMNDDPTDDPAATFDASPLDGNESLDDILAQAGLAALLGAE